MLNIPPLPASGATDSGPSIDPRVSSAIRKASQDSGAPFELMMATAKIESSFQPAAKASGSSASGLYQFTEQTWLDAVKRHGAEHGLAPEAAGIVDRSGRLGTSDPAQRQRILDMRNDPAIAAAVAGDYMRDMANTLGASLGRAPTSGEIYLGHFLGVGGAKQMLQAPANQAAADVLPSAAHANASMFYAKDGTPYTAAQFLQRVQNRLSGAMADMGSLVSSASTLTDRTALSSAASTTKNLADKVTAKTPDAPDAGASGWGVSTPTALRSLGETQVMASLMSAFTHADQPDANPRLHRNAAGLQMPPSLLTALQMTGTKA